MLTVDPRTSMLVVIDIQAKLAPAIDGAASVVANARRLAAAAELLAAFMHQSGRIWGVVL